MLVGEGGRWGYGVEGFVPCDPLYQGSCEGLYVLAVIAY